jgi:hypothetical protein
LQSEVNKKLKKNEQGTSSVTPKQGGTSSVTPKPASKAAAAAAARANAILEASNGFKPPEAKKGLGGFKFPGFGGKPKPEEESEEEEEEEVPVRQPVAKQVGGGLGGFKFPGFGGKAAAAAEEEEEESEEEEEEVVEVKQPVKAFGSPFDLLRKK